MLAVYDVHVALVALLLTVALERILTELTIPHKIYSSAINKLCVGLIVQHNSVILNIKVDMLAPGSVLHVMVRSCDERGMKGQVENSLPSNWLENVVHNKDESAAKAEDSEIHIHLWDDVLGHQLSISINNKHRRALAILRPWSISL